MKFNNILLLVAVFALALSVQASTPANFASADDEITCECVSTTTCSEGQEICLEYFCTDGSSGSTGNTCPDLPAPVTPPGQ